MRVLVTAAWDNGYDGCRLRQDYIRRLVQAGLTPLVAAPLPPERAWAALANMSGLVLTGGGDASPELFPQLSPDIPPLDCCPERDQWELALLGEAEVRGLPVLGVCRGMQLINLYRGGGLIQNLPPGPVLHQQRADRCQPSHGARLTGPLARLLGTNIKVNSHHHQGVSELGWGLAAQGWAADGLIEALVSREGPPILGVQWHPECLAGMEPIFGWLAERARES